MNETTLQRLHLQVEGRTDAPHHAALEAELLADPAVADRLAALADVEARLHRHFQLRPSQEEVTSVDDLWRHLRPRPRPPKEFAAAPIARAFDPQARHRWRQHQRRLLAAAAVLLALLALAAVIRWLGGTSPAPIAMEQPPTVPAWKPVADVPLVEADQPPPPDPASDPALQRRLATFFVEDWAPSGKKFAAALESLLAEGRRLNHLRDATIENLRFEFADEAAAEALSERPSFGRYLALSMKDTVALLAAQAGAAVTYVAPSTLRIAVKEDAPDAGKMVTREYDMPSNFLMFGRNYEEESSVIPGTAFTLQERTLPEWLEFWGILMTDDKQASDGYPASGLVATMNGRDHGVLSLLRQAVNGQASGTVSLSAKLIEKHSPSPWLIEEKIMTEAEFQLWLRDMNQAPGTNLLTTPSVITRSGQRAKIEVAREFIPPSSEPPSDPPAPHGLVIDLTPVLTGECVRVEADVTLSRLPEASGLAPSRTAGKPEDLETLHSEILALIPSGQTALFSVGTSSQGWQVVTTLTASPITQRAEANVEVLREFSYPEPEEKGPVPSAPE